MKKTCLISTKIEEPSGINLLPGDMYLINDHTFIYVDFLSCGFSFSIEILTLGSSLPRLSLDLGSL